MEWVPSPVHVLALPILFALRSLPRPLGSDLSSSAYLCCTCNLVPTNVAFVLDPSSEVATPLCGDLSLLLNTYVHNSGWMVGTSDLLLSTRFLTRLHITDLTRIRLLDRQTGRHDGDPGYARRQ